MLEFSLQVCGSEINFFAYFVIACSNEFPEIISTDLAFVKDSGALTKFDLNYQGRISSFNCLENPDSINGIPKHIKLAPIAPIA